MNNKFINNIEINNYKCFNHFEAEGFKRVNLIGGKNNIGKTAFMEACYLNIQSNTSYAIANIIVARYKIDLYSELIKEIGVKYIYNFLNEESIGYTKSIINTNIINKIITYDKAKITDNSQNKNIVFIDSIKSSSSNLEKYYSKIIENKLENKIDKLLKEFDVSLESFRIISSQPKCSLESDGKFYNLNEFGDGLHKYITFISLLYGVQNTVIFIDEIELGIHYTQFDKLWNIMLSLSEERNIQLFITTHSKECIESYNRVSKELNDTNAIYFEMAKNKKTQKIFMRNLDNEQLEYELSHEGRYRGE